MHETEQVVGRQEEALPIEAPVAEGSENISGRCTLRCRYAALVRMQRKRGREPISHAYRIRACSDAAETARMQVPRNEVPQVPGPDRFVARRELLSEAAEHNTDRQQRAVCQVSPSWANWSAAIVRVGRRQINMKR